MLKSLKENIILCISYLLWGAYWFYISYNIPYEADDWNWGSKDGIKQLFSGSINSRYAGNFFAVCLTRNIWIKNIVMTFFIFLLIYMITKCIKLIGNIEKVNDIYVYNFVSLMIFAMNKEIWAQTFGWISGFCNYIISALCLFVYIYLYIIIDRNKYKDNNLISNILLLFFSIFSMLFLENITVVILIMSLFALIKYYVKNRKVLKDLIIILIGNIIGTAFMFLNNIYFKLFSKGKGLDNSTSGREFIFKSEEYGNNIFFALKTRICFLIKLLFKYELSIVIVVGTIFIIYFLLKKKEMFNVNIVEIIYLCVIVLILSIPFVFILVIGPRVYVHSYLIFVVIFGVFIFNLLEKNEKYRKTFIIGISVLSIVFAIFLGIDYYKIGNHYRKITRIIEENRNADEVLLPCYPEKVQGNLWRADNISNDYLYYYFSEFYNLNNVETIYFYNKIIIGKNGVVYIY